MTPSHLVVSSSDHSFLSLRNKWHQTSAEAAQRSSPCSVVHVLEIGDDNSQTFQVIDEIRHYLMFAYLSCCQEPTDSLFSLSIYISYEQKHSNHSII